MSLPVLGPPTFPKWWSSIELRKAAVFSRGIRGIAHLERFLPFQSIVYRPGARQVDDVDVVLCWGNKETGADAAHFAQSNGKPLWRLEDGFFRSVGSGRGESPLSLVLDDQGIFYDARSSSRLEQILNGSDSDDDPLSESALLDRARSLIDRVRQTRVSKYNEGRSQVDLPETERHRVLLVDQTRGDASIAGALADEETFVSMVEWALAEFPDSEILVKSHPEVTSGVKKGCIPRAFSKLDRVSWIASDLAPGALVSTVQEVVTVSSQLGFDALCAGKPVTCFGMPFYAGWGLTTDRKEVSRRKRKLTLPELCAGAWFLYPSYINPVTGERCSAEDAVEHLALQREMEESNSGRTVAVGFSGWKRRYVQPYLASRRGTVRFARDEEVRELVRSNEVDRVVAWGQKLSDSTAEALRETSVDVLKMEDGFLRSNHLGSDLTSPASLIVDPIGIYYDASRSSRLEKLLEQRSYSDLERERARLLIDLIQRERLSKYNVQLDEELNVDEGGKVLRLVIGQVDDDAAIRLATDPVRSNGQLIRRVRSQYPDDLLLYKPHPDVLSGNRVGELTEEEAALADRVVTGHSITACLDRVSAVHTMTSLVGFESLLRGLQVHTYGMPFYAGWGLTQDAMSCGRRTRKIALEELVYATLILYPRYFSRNLKQFISPEQAVHELVQERASEGRGTAQPSLGRKLKRLVRYLRGEFFS